MPLRVKTLPSCRVKLSLAPIAPVATHAPCSQCLLVSILENTSSSRTHPNSENRHFLLPLPPYPQTLGL